MSKCSKFTTLPHLQINMFAVNYMVLEQPRIGAFVPSYRFEPVRLLRYHTPGAAFTLIFEVIFCVYLLFYIVSDNLIAAPWPTIGMI